MATTPSWSEFNPTGAVGTNIVETANIGNCNWKNIDDTSTAFNLSAIPAGNPSFWKIQCLKLSNAGASASVYGLTYTISTATGTGTGGANAWTVIAAVPITTASPFLKLNGSTAATLTGGTGFVIQNPMPTSGTTLPGGWGQTTYTPAVSPNTGPFLITPNAAPNAGSPATVAGAGGVLYATTLYTQLLTTTNALPGQINSGVNLQITATWTES